MRVSVASYSFHGLLSAGRINVFGYIESARHRYRLDLADIWNGMLESTDEEYIKKVKASLDEAELSLANLCCDWCQAWDDDPNKRARNRENAWAHLRAAVILQARTVRFDFGGQQAEMTDEQFDWTVSCFKEYAAFAADNGFKVGPENHYGPARVLANQLKVAEAVSSPAYGVLLHFGNWVEDADACDKAMTPLVMHTHIDAKHCAGDLDVTLSALIENGYSGCYSVEHHSAKDEHAQVAVQLALLKRTLTVNGVKR